MDAQPDTVGISSASMFPVQPQLCSLNTEDSVNSTNTQPGNFELCHESFISVGSNNLPIAVPPNDSSFDVASVISRYAQLEQENNELHAENIALKRKMVVSNHWTGLLDWNTGMDYWTDTFLVFKHIVAVVVSLIESFWLGL